MATKSANSPKLTCADLFAGAGGFTVGLHQAGFRSVFFNEISPRAAESYQHNFPDATPFVRGIEELTVADIQAECDIESIDVVVGGPPCQGFSINALQRTEDDPRNHLFREYIRLVLEGLRPKFIVFENVPGLISLDSGKTLQQVLLAFEQCGYKVAYKILNAAHYGVAQERWRLFILGTRLPGITLSFPEPRHFSTRTANFTGGRAYTFSYAIGEPEPSLFDEQLLAPPVTIRDAISDLPAIPSGGGLPEMDYDARPCSEYQRALRTTSTLYNHVCANLTPVNIERMRHVRPGGSWRDIPFELLPKGMQRARRSDHTKRYGRLDPEDVSGTILTKCDPHWGTVVHYDQDRVISVREAARFQSFPDDFQFLGSKVEMYRQVGNAVPPLLAQAIALHLRAWLESARPATRANRLPA